MRKRNKIRLFSFSAALLLALGGFLWQYQTLLTQSKTELEYSYRRALNDLTDYITQMEYSLQKSTYANTATMRGVLSAELLEESGGAKAAMAVLPFSEEKMENISRFVSQVGDYAMALTRRTAAGGKMEDEDFDNLDTMRAYSVKLRDALAEIQAHLSVEKASVTKTHSLLNNVDDIDKIPNFDDSLDSVATEFAEYPAMLYDGPFSDHILQQTAKFLEDKSEISSADAAKKAADFLKCDVKDLTESGSSETAALSAYVFTTGDSRINVTKQGGEISYFKKAGEIQQGEMDYEGALKAASKFLKECGVDTFRESYYVINDNTCTINFSFLLTEENREIICYPDLIKVTVDLHEGGTVEYDATGYLMNHRNRVIALPKLTAEQAQENISPRLTVEHVAQAIIPTPGKYEALTYEFKCKDKEKNDVLVYVNAETGMEEQIYLLSYSDNGVLTF